MSVFSVDPKAGNPVTTEVLDEVCKSLGVKIKDEEREDYRKLLAVFDESAMELMDMDGTTTLVLNGPEYDAYGLQTMYPLQISNASHERTSTDSAEKRTLTAPGPGDVASKTRDRTPASSPPRLSS